VKVRKNIKNQREAGKIFPAFSFCRLLSKSDLGFLIFLCFLLICSSCRPKTASVLEKIEPTTVIDSIAIVEGNPNEDEQFSDPIEESPDIVIEKDPIPELLLSFSKKGCYGNCPEFEFKMFSNGHLIYEGQDKVKNMGKFEARIDPLRIYKIYEIADQYHFFQLEDFYPEKGKLIGELPSTVTFLKREGMEKNIHNNHDSPTALRKFETFLEDWINTILWNKMDQ